MADKSIVSFRALQLANEQRSAYGLRYNDFQRYRKHCANRTHRLRSTLKMTHGKGRDFKKLSPLSTENVQSGHLELLLMEAERAWAYAQELIAASLLPANADQAALLRHSATGRFRRAVHWVTQLLTHCQALYQSERLSAENLIQATVYTFVLNGRFLRYRDEFDDALLQLCVARSLLDELAATASTSRDQALATLFSDEIGPEIRYCAHELGRQKAYDVDGFVAELGPSNRESLVDGCTAILSKMSAGSATGAGASRSQLKELFWEDEPVPIRNPELVDVLLKVQEAEARLETFGAATSKKAVAAYDAVLLHLNDAEDVARKLSTANKSSGLTASSTTRDIHFVYAYLVYHLLSRRIQRDLLLMSTLLSTSGSDGRLYPAVVKLLDTVLQSLDQMRTLSIVDDNPGLSSAVDARICYAKAERCFFLAQCYVPLKKYAEALTLIQRASLYMREAQSSLSPLEGTDSITAYTAPFFPLTSDAIAQLEKKIGENALQLKRDWLAFNGGSVDPESSKTYKKLLFFDIALNYVELDTERLYALAGKEVPKPEARAPAVLKQEGAPEKKKQAEVVPEEETPSAPVAAPRGGLSSLLGGWWGRS
ncbi:hypothetical protein FISHEDRAFT_66788 [Fistulina hepatica ATCC 64428]|uniref:Signal recognition particle subunit SRP68 n=1 Tax=Fistulina hepatica ATCC 64428 TaxID=1128425 RepID=A0A0D7A731_9AGAR|nr:hypothetical protein FISHEDRAFT_66788 [Fistulina hepatica ATCC 64428]